MNPCTPAQDTAFLSIMLKSGVYDLFKDPAGLDWCTERKYLLLGKTLVPLLYVGTRSKSS